MKDRINPNAPKVDTKVTTDAKVTTIVAGNFSPNKISRPGIEHLRECPKTSQHPDKMISLREFLNVKLPRKQAPKDLLRSIKAQLKAQE